MVLDKGIVATGPALSAATRDPWRRHRLRRVFELASQHLRRAGSPTDAHDALRAVVAGMRDAAGHLTVRWHRRPSEVERMAVELAAVQSGYRLPVDHLTAHERRAA